MVETENLYDYSRKVSTIGGGGGQNTALRGFRELNDPKLITAIFGTWDNGGMSGLVRLKDGVMPPGDYFMCLYGLMHPDQSKSAQALLNDRARTPMLRDVLAVAAERKYHGIQEGIDALRDLFRIEARLFPVSTMDLHLNAETRNGHILEGETSIDLRGESEDFDPEDITSNIFFDNDAHANPLAVEAIDDSELIVSVPGSPYTSIFPHLLVNGIPQSIMNSEGKLVIAMNLMTTRGEDHHLKFASDWLKVYQHLLGDKRRINSSGQSRIDYIVANCEEVDTEIVEAYRNKGQELVQIDEDEIRRLAPGVQVIRKPLLDAEELEKKYIRHDPIALAKSILELR